MSWWVYDHQLSALAVRTFIVDKDTRNNKEREEEEE
jgi:hypothetical protein